MQHSVLVNDIEYNSYKNKLKSYLIVNCKENNFAVGDVILIVSPDINDAEKFNNQSALKYKIVFKDYDETVPIMGIKGIKRNYCILNLVPLSQKEYEAYNNTDSHKNNTQDEEL
jgi:hypothetical protein